MSLINDNESAMVTGIAQLLGKEEYPPGEVVKECTDHQTDGFIYDDEPNPIETTLCCKNCGIHYTVPSAGINFDIFRNAN